MLTTRATTEEPGTPKTMGAPRIGLSALPLVSLDPIAPAPAPALAPAPAPAPAPASRYPALVRLVRPRQWVKNLICFLPLFCSGRFFELPVLLATTLTFVAFCLGSSFVYVLNDIADQENDRAHPIKRFRPIAAGEIGTGPAFFVGALLLATSALCAVSSGFPVLWVVLTYVLVNLCYSFYLKHVAILDVMLISLGFILRLAAGGVAGDVHISAWLVLCAFFLSLFLAFGKRRAEMNSHKSGSSRRVLNQYSKLMLDRLSNISATLAITPYAVFTVLSRPDHGFLITCPPVVFGILRYLLLVESNAEAEAPELILMRDRPIQIAILLWAISYAAVLYFGLHISVL